MDLRRTPAQDRQPSSAPAKVSDLFEGGVATPIRSAASPAAAEAPAAAKPAAKRGRAAAKTAEAKAPAKEAAKEVTQESAKAPAKTAASKSAPAKSAAVAAGGAGRRRSVRQARSQDRRAPSSQGGRRVLTCRGPGAPPSRRRAGPSPPGRRSGRAWRPIRA